MERVAFLIERTGERISCLLNPEFLEARRVAGVRTRREAGGFLGGAARTDHPLIATGGGVTEIDLRLLFDTEIARLENGQQPGAAVAADGTSLPAMDVRELTRPIWDLSENATAEGFGAPPSVRFIWGKSWNIPGVIIAVAERLERFDINGTPQRSWLTLRLRRVEEPEPRPVPPMPVTPQFETPTPGPGGADEPYPARDVPVDNLGTPLDRLDQIADEQYGMPWLAPILGAFNSLDDLLTLPEGTSLSLPPLSLLTGRT
ncbi:MAG TPA: hypothetical protein VMU08_14180 [Rhizomicrobium sp.]|nr:hypothetical protein [Rhizomicrobium sp.]